MQKKDTVVEIDLLKVFRLLWSKIWLIILAAIIAGVCALGYARFMVKPEYKASTWIYVNNASISVSSATYSISTSQISGARSLVDTYSVILSSRSMMNKVLAKTGLPYNTAQLKKMISCSAINDTEIFSVTVTSHSPDEAALIANTIADILPDMIADIVDGSSVRVVDYAIAPTVRSAPSYSRYAAVGAVLGAFLCALVIFLVDYFDDVIHSDEFLANYDVPILARVPDMSEKSSGEGYYSYGYGNGKGA